MIIVVPAGASMLIAGGNLPTGACARNASDNTLWLPGITRVPPLRSSTAVMVVSRLMVSGLFESRAISWSWCSACGTPPFNAIEAINEVDTQFAPRASVTSCSISGPPWVASGSCAIRPSKQRPLFTQQLMFWPLGVLWAIPARRSPSACSSTLVRTRDTCASDRASSIMQ